MNARCVMVLGTEPGAGKSWVSTALCRHYARQGLRVAPFQAVHVGPHACSVALEPGSGEIAASTWLQAQSAGVIPDVRMNPLMIKRQADAGSQVVMLGLANRALAWASPAELGVLAWPAIRRALEELRAEHEVVVIDGTGFPMAGGAGQHFALDLQVAHHAQAKALMVVPSIRSAPLGRAQGMGPMLGKEERVRMAGFVLNRFAGDERPSGLDLVVSSTGVPLLGILPSRHPQVLPGSEPERDAMAPGAMRLTVVVLDWPHLAQREEFQPLRLVPGVRLVWARRPEDCAHADWIVLPGSHDVGSDLAWMRAQGLDRAVTSHATQGGAVLGLGGGLCMLGEAMIDLQGVAGNAPGLGLLPLVSQIRPGSKARPREALFGNLRGPWAALSGRRVRGLESAHGPSAAHPAMLAGGHRLHEVMPGLAWQNATGHVLGLYLHGLFEDAAIVQALLGTDSPTQTQVFDDMADLLEQHLAAGALDSLRKPAK